MKLTLKYPLRLGDRTYPAGTEVRKGTLEEMQQVWPSITYRADSAQIGVWLPEQERPTIVLKSQLVVTPREDAVRVCENCGREGIDGLHESVCPSTNPQQE